MYLDKLTTFDLDSYFADMRSGKVTGTPLSYNTVRLTRQYFSQALKQAVKWGMLAKDPSAGVSIGKQVSRVQEIHPLTEEEMHLFLQAAKGYQWELLFHVLLFSGTRIGKVIALRWEHIDLAKGILTVKEAAKLVKKTVKFGPPKNGKARQVTIPAFLVDRLAEANSGNAKAFVFGGHKGKPASKSSIDKAMKKILEAAGLPKIRLHDLRHTHATQLITAGENIKAVSERLGHSDINITLRTYHHVMPGMQEQIADNLNARYLVRVEKGEEQTSASMN